MNKQKNISFKMNSQSGFTMWGFLSTGAIVIFIIYIVALLVPVYAADSAIKKALNNSLETLERQNIKKKSLIVDIDKRLYVDGVYEGPDLNEAVNVKREKSVTKVTVEYRKDIPLFYNIGMHLDFKHFVEK